MNEKNVGSIVEELKQKRLKAEELWRMANRMTKDGKTAQLQKFALKAWDQAIDAVNTAVESDPVIVRELLVIAREKLESAASLASQPFGHGYIENESEAIALLEPYGYQPKLPSEENRTESDRADHVKAFRQLQARITALGIILTDSELSSVLRLQPDLDIRKMISAYRSQLEALESNG